MKSQYESTKDLTADCPTFVDIMLMRSALQGTKLAFRFLIDGDITGTIRDFSYSELDRRARAIGAWLLKQNLEGERVILIYTQEYEFIEAFFGCLYAGVIAVPAYPPDPRRLKQTLPRLEAIVADSGAKMILASSVVVQFAEALAGLSPNLSKLSRFPSASIEDEQAEHWQRPDIVPESMAFLQYTSGSTGTPKGVMVSHANLLNNQRMIQRGFDHDEKLMGVCWLPLFHDMGLIGNTMQPIFVGGQCIFMSPLAFLQRPLRWLQAISHYKAHTSGGPNFVYDLCVRKIGEAERDKLDLSSWQVAYNGAEPVRAETLDRFAAYFAPCGFRMQAFYPTYGLAEATLFVTGGLKHELPVVRQLDTNALSNDQAIFKDSDGPETKRLVGCGRMHENEQIRIVNPNDLMECKPGHVGEIWISNSSVAKGYWNPLEARNEVFGVFLAETGEGPFLRTGDLGFLDNGELFITGRIKGLIIIRGRNYYPQDIELTVEQSDPRIRPGCCAAFSLDEAEEERLVIAAELSSRDGTGDSHELAAKICATVSANHGVRVNQVVFLAPRTLPKTSSGKIERNTCRAALVSGELEMLDSKTFSIEHAYRDSGDEDSQETGGALQDLLQAEVARMLLMSSPADVKVDCPLQELGFDSLMAVELSVALSEMLGRSLPPTLVYEHPTIAEMISFLTKGLSSEIRATDYTLPTAINKALQDTRQAIPHHDDAFDPDENQGEVHIGREGTKINGWSGVVGSAPLSFTQDRYWRLTQIDARMTQHAQMWRLRGHVDTERLAWSFSQVIARHSILRTSFPKNNAEPIQYIHSAKPMRLSAEDVEGSNADERLQAVLRITAEERQNPMAIEAEPPFKCRLFRLDDLDYVLVMLANHIIYDDWSHGILLSELQAFYEGTELLPEPKVQYSDYAKWWQDEFTSEKAEGLKAFWRQTLDGAIPDVPLPYAATRGTLPYRAGSVQTSLSPNAYLQLHRNITSQRFTLFNTLLAAIGQAVYRWTALDDIIIGTTCGDRVRPEFKYIFGPCINWLPIRLRFQKGKDLDDALRCSYEATFGALQHHRCPLDAMGLEDISDTMPSFRKVTQPYNLKLTIRRPKAFASLDKKVVCEPISIKASTTRYDLEWIVIQPIVPGHNSLIIRCQYNEDCLRESQIQRLIDDVQVSLTEIANRK